MPDWVEVNEKSYYVGHLSPEQNYLFSSFIFISNNDNLYILYNDPIYISYSAPPYKLP